MSLKHKVSISIAQQDGRESSVIKSGSVQVRNKLLKFLFGEKVNVLVLTPGDSVETVEIHQIGGGKGHESKKTTA
ncbi:hypothetical protein [uncultured Acetobacterium sp.]|uniref:hypothetical protein n=1 Tax=uncultured Acetobacterium sp. TaxID=217139 RepID=UPI0025CC3BA5|nr:hypothetical protein [uncultured Acetobacterium sp.]